MGRRQSEWAWWWTPALFAAALGVRVLYLLSVHDAYFFHHLQTEPLHYDEWATSILDASPWPSWPLEQSPGYPYFVAAVYGLLGRTVTAVALVQIVVDALTCVLIAAAARAYCGVRVGLIAGTLAAAYGPLIYFSGEQLPATLFVCVTMLALVVSLGAPLGQGSDAPNKPSPARWTLAGCVWSLTLLVRSESILGWPLVWLDAWRRGGRSGLWRTAAPMVLVVATFVTINVAATHRLLLLTTSAGTNLWLGNNPDADGVNPFVFGPLEATASSLRAESTDQVDLSRRLVGRALSFWRTTPLEAARLAGKKFLWTWTNRELPNTSDIDWQTAQSWLFRPKLFPLSFGTILPFAVAGAVLLRRRWRELGLLAALPAVAVSTALLFFTNARFRLIMVPTVLILSAVALDHAVTMLRERRRPDVESVLALMGIGVGLLAAWGNFSSVRSYRIPQISVNTGVLEREAGDLPAAARHLREGLEGDPYDTIGWIHLALALEQLRYTRAALQAYLQALALVRDDAELRDMAVRFAQRHAIDPALITAYVSASDTADQLRIAEQAFAAVENTTGGR